MNKFLLKVIFFSLSAFSPCLFSDRHGEVFFMVPFNNLQLQNIFFLGGGRAKYDILDHDTVHFHFLWYEWEIGSYSHPPPPTHRLSTPYRCLNETLFIYGDDIIDNDVHIR